MTTEPRVANPPQELQPGAHDLGDGKVSFALWAPWKKSVHVVGDFNGWDRGATPLAVSESGLWWALVELPQGEHAYQFLIDEEYQIGDPYARKLRWAGGNVPHCIVTVGERPYEWHDGEFGIRSLNHLVIYELHVGDFSPEGIFKGVTQRLDHIKSLGVDAIELMPIQEFPGDMSWGYNPAYFFCPESAYGTVNDLKELVDGAHQRGIGVILDMVFNHVHSDSPLNMLFQYDGNPYMSSDGNPWGFPDLNHWNDATKRLIADIQAYWLTEFHIDGFRYDHIEGIGYDATSGASFITWSARQSKPHAYLIAEQLVDPTSVVRDTEMDASWHPGFHDALVAQLREGGFHGRSYGDMSGLMSEIDFRSQGYGDNAQAVNYVETHDQERICFEVQTNGLDHGAALRKSKLGAVALYTATGVPMLFAGQELGMDTPKTIDANKLQWERAGDPAVQDLIRTLGGLAMLRHDVPALGTNNIEPLLVDNDRKILVFKRWDDGGSQVVVALNFAPFEQYADVQFPRGGRWHEWLFDYDEDLPDAPHSIQIPGSGAKVWVAA
jgi:1,4-alpha-glucan branching enzyme